jgi:uncharacterized membrane protein
VAVSAPDPVTQTLVVSVGLETPVGEHALTLRAEGGGVVREASLTLTVRPAPSFQATLSPTSLTVQQGSSGTTTLTLTPQNGFTGTVSLSLVGAPSGVTLTPNSLSVTGADPISQTLTLSVGEGVAPGTYELRPRLQGGSTTRELPFTLEVRARTTPDFTLALEPASLSVEAGHTAQTTLVITPQYGFNGQVTVELLGVPPGVTFSPTSFYVTGAQPVQRVLTLNVLQSTNPGRYAVKVRVSSQNLLHEADLDLTVTAPPPPPTPSFTLSTPDPTLSVQVGRSVTFPVTFTPSGGFTGDVNLSLVRRDTNAPVPDLTLAPTRVRLSGAPLTQDLSLTASFAAPYGAYPMKLRAEGGGVVREVFLDVTVEPPPHFQATLNPEWLTVPQGGQAQTSLTLTPPQGFTGQVDLYLANAPQGVSLSPTSVNITGPDPASYTLTLTVPQSVAPQYYRPELRLAWWDQGKLYVQSVTFTLEVTAASGGNPPPNPDFQVTLSPTSLSIQQGGSGTATLTLTPQNGFSGTVSLSLVGAPSGVSLSPTSLSVTGTNPVTQALTLSVAGTTPTGAYSLKVRAASGSLTKETSLNLTVTVPPSFTLSLSPTDPKAPRSGQAQVSLTLTPQGGFQGQVALSLVGAPQGLTLSPTSLQVSGSAPVTQALTLDASGVAPGTYTFALRAEGGGVTQQGNLTLTVYTLTVAQVEFGQTVVLPAGQWTGQDLPLVGGKPALLRVHLTASPAPVSLSTPLTGQMTLSLAGETRFTAPLSFTCPSTVPTATDPGDLSTTCNALLPTASLPSSVYAGVEYYPDEYLTLTVTLTPQGGSPAQASASLRPPIHVTATVVPVVIDDPNDPAYNQMPNYGQVVNLLPTLLKRYFMVSSVEVRVRKAYRTQSTDIGAIGAEVGNLNDQETGNTQLYVGVLHGGYFGGGNGGGRTALVSARPDPVSLVRHINHEVGHAFGMSHSKGCDTPGADPAYPYPNGSIGVYGWDPLTAPLTGPLVPKTYKDFMNYCDPHSGSWASDYTYRTTYRDPWGWGLRALMGY